MRKFIIGLVLLLSCEKEECKIKTCFMFISDAIPVQFWINGVPTFNEKDEAGVEKICFYQKWNCDDEIKIQFTDDEYDSYVLKILNSNGEELEELNFTQISEGVWFLEFIPSELDTPICNEFIQLKIFSNQPELDLQNEEFSTDSIWYNGGTGSDWTISGGSANSSFVTSQSPYHTKNFIQDIDLPNQEYTFSIEYTVSSLAVGTGRATPRIHFLSSGSVVQTNNMGSQTIGEGTFQASLVVSSIPDGVDAVAFSVLAVNPDEYDLSVNYFRMQAIVYPQIEIAKTDFLDIAENHINTRLISYTNELDFAGIEYDVDYPPTFNIRIESKFYVPRSPQETESEPDSEGNIIKLSSSSKKQRRLEVDPMPPYMHDKLILILQHNSIFINNLSWVQEENYEINEINEKYGLFNSSVWLTQMDNNYYTNVN